MGIKKAILWLLLINTNVLLAQNPQFYIGTNNEKHLCGPFELNALENDSIYKKWYKENYESFEVKAKKRSWTKDLKDIKVEIYLGTWCGDSKKWVPRFVKIWDELGLSRDNLEFTALYDMVENDTKYKQGPNHEEKGKKIHRVPTFIFTKEGEEIARMVEYPVNNLETDLAQIALGFPSEPNYRGASYILELFTHQKLENIIEDERKHLYAVYDLINGNPSELNTLGYVFLELGKIQEALFTFYLNTRCFKYNPNVYDSYAEALAKDGQIEKAVENYQKVLLLDRSNQNARAQIGKLNKK